MLFPSDPGWTRPALPPNRRVPTTSTVCRGRGLRQLPQNTLQDAAAAVALVSCGVIRMAPSKRFPAASRVTVRTRARVQPARADAIPSTEKTLAPVNPSVFGF